MRGALAKEGRWPLCLGRKRVLWKELANDLRKMVDVSQKNEGDFASTQKKYLELGQGDLGRLSRTRRIAGLNIGLPLWICNILRCQGGCE